MVYLRMDYKQLIEAAYEKAASATKFDKTIGMADMVDAHHKVLTEYNETTEIILNRVKDEISESLEDAEKMVNNLRESLIALPE
ncbi:MAG: hypothetical protein Q8K66_07550 [Sediminibacterium sp.]|nr:hypothetical protein [Sediminibacterium sp.]MDP3127981.1 hypothetical protein [Sediminibacterium sp.]